MDKKNKEIIDLKEENKKLKNEINEIKSIIDKQNNENKVLKEINSFVYILFNIIISLFLIEFNSKLLYLLIFFPLTTK